MVLAELDSLLLYKRRAEGVEVGIRRQLAASVSTVRNLKADITRLKKLLVQVKHERDHLVRDFAKKLDQTGHIVYDLPEGKGKFVRKDVYESELVLQEQRLAEGWLQLRQETEKRKKSEQERARLCNYAMAMERVSNEAVARRVEAVEEASTLEMATERAVKEREAERALKEAAVAEAAAWNAKHRETLRDKKTLIVQKHRLKKKKTELEFRVSSSADKATAVLESYVSENLQYEIDFSSQEEKLRLAMERIKELITLNANLTERLERPQPPFSFGKKGLYSMQMFSPQVIPPC